jgi:hypothetical protein
MGDLRIDYSGLSSLVNEGEKQSEARGERRAKLRAFPLRATRTGAVVALLVVLPFVLLIRGGVFAYRVWSLGTWPSLLLAVAATALVLALYAWAVSHRLGAGEGLKKLFTRAAVGVSIAYVAYALVFVASANVKSDEVRSEYAALHPLLRMASSALILVDPASVITDAGRSEEDYWLMGLPKNEASLHFEQEDGFVHALDLRTIGRSEVRNRAVELAFWALGFHSLRHVGTADHLHVSLRLPG